MTDQLTYLLLIAGMCQVKVRHALKWRERVTNDQFSRLSSAQRVLILARFCTGQSSEGNMVLPLVVKNAVVGSP